MAFPATPLPLYAGIAPGASPTSAAGLNLTDITADIRVADGVELQVGKQDEGTRAETTGARTTIDNRSGNYSRANPLGTWFGLLDKGTPVQFRVTRINDQFTRTTSNGWGTDADSGILWAHTSLSVWSTNGTAGQCALAAAGASAFALPANDVVGADDAEVSYVVSLSAVTTGAAWASSAVLRYSSTINYYRLQVELGLAGAITAKIVKVVAGVSTDLTSSNATGLTYSAGTKIRLRARAIGPTLQIRCWLDGNTEPTVWHAQADDNDLTGQTMGLHQSRITGNTNAGTLTSTIDEFRADAIRCTTPIPEWPVRWDRSGRDVTAPVAGAGILRRLGQGQAALRSPMYRQLPLWSPTGFWPCEDGDSSTVAASALSGGKPATVADVTFGDAGPPGASAAISLNNAASSIRGTTTLTPSGNGFTAMTMFKLSTAVGADSTLLLVESTGTVRQWQIVAAVGGSVKLFGYAADSTTLVSAGPYAWLTADPTKWTALRLQVTDSGGTISWNLAWTQVSVPIINSGSSTLAGTAGRPTVINATGCAGTSYSMLWLGPSTLPFTSDTFYNIFAGYAGETAGARIARLSSEEGVPLRAIGTLSATAAMGAQTAATYLDLVRECEDADQGVLYETGLGLGYITYRARLNGSPVMVLDFASGHIAAPPEPVDDDQRLVNTVTLTRTGGSSVTLDDDASVAKSGIYADEVTVNLARDNQLPDQAGWRLSLGTLDELRWPRIMLNLARNPSLIATWCKVRPSSRITIANPPAAVATGEVLDLIVEGWTERLSAYSWDVEIVCSPASGWTAGVWGTSRYDSHSTTLAAAMTSGDTWALVATANRAEFWSWKSCPYDVIISGQRNTVLGNTRPDVVQTFDSSFEDGTLGTWYLNPDGSASLLQISGIAPYGTYSAAITVVGTPGYCRIRPALGSTVAAAGSYTVIGWVRRSSAGNVDLETDWLDGGGGYLSSSSSSIAVAANTWTEISATFTAPASAATGYHGLALTGSPAAGTVLRFKGLDFIRTDIASSRQVMVLQRGVNGIAKALPSGAEVHIASPGRYAI